ncbi:NACHT domain-containing protein [Actinomadura madurae]|uniref:NACHT domain-containing protein n=2 Tax=Actinomadura madurae TaxID=1993 RepID=A0A1I5EBW0_9ACTN|nr:NACHT domain-containing protein [Actinomadura madurae]
MRQVGESGAQLYNVILDECCDCLVRIVIQLPQFAPRASVETLSRISGLADQVNVVLARLPARSVTAPEGTSSDREFTQRYLEHLSDTLDTLELFGVRFERFTRPRITLSVAYIGLSVSTEKKAGRVTETLRGTRVSDWRGDQQFNSSVRVESVLAESRLLLLRGEAGAGKSTLLRWIAITAARGKFSGDMTSWNGCIPFLIKLRSFSGERMPRPEEFIDRIADNLTGIMPRGWVHRQLIAGKALILVDGVDELVGQDRHAVREWLHGLISDFPQTRIVVTSRPVAASADWLRAEGFFSAFLERMSPADIRALIQHWHSAVRHCGDLPCPPERLPSYETALLARLESAVHLRTLAANPLLAAMLCALNLDRETQLPRDRMGLYGAALDMLLVTRDAKRGIPSSRSLSLERAQQIRILQYIAAHLSNSNRVELPKALAEQLIADRLAAMPYINQSAPEVLEYLLDRSGVIREPVLGRVDFVHRTVQEYLTAKHIADLGDMDILIRNAHRDQWRETVIMAAGHANEPLRNELIAGILSRVEAEPRHARRLKLLVVACMETLPAIPRGLESSMSKCLADLVPPRDLASARSLATAGEPVLDRLPRSLSQLSDSSARATVSVAWMINGPKALEFLEGYGCDPRFNIQQELDNAWDFFDPGVFAERVLARAPKGVTRSLTLRSPGQLHALNKIPEVTEISISSDVPIDLSVLASKAQQIRKLSIYSGVEADSLSALTTFARLKDFTFVPRVSPNSIDFLRELSPLERLYVSQCDEVEDYSALASHKQLQGLLLYSPFKLAGVQDLPPLDHVQVLALMSSRLQHGLGELIAAAPNVRDLMLDNCPWIDDLNHLDSLSLRMLWLANCPAPVKLEKIAHFSELESLDVSGSQVTDLTPLSDLKKLRILWLKDCRNIVDLTPLAALPKLTMLHLGEVSPTLDMAPLANRRNLKVTLAPGQEVVNSRMLGRRLRFDH